MKRITNPFSEVPEKGSVSAEYFFRMMSPQATELAQEYLDDEMSLLKDTINSLPNPKEFNLIAVAGGQLGMLEIGLEKTRSYTCIEPLADLYIGKPLQYLVDRDGDINVIKKLLSDVKKTDLPKGKNLFVFMFNILAYVEHPMRDINEIIKPGDVIFASTWSKTAKAKEIRTKYFNFLNSFEEKVIIDPELTKGICDLEKFPFDKLKFPSTHKYVKTDVVEILEIKL